MYNTDFFTCKSFEQENLITIGTVLALLIVLGFTTSWLNRLPALEPYSSSRDERDSGNELKKDRGTANSICANIFLH